MKDRQVKNINKGEHMIEKDKLLIVNNLKMYFQVNKNIFGKKRYLKAVDDIDFFINNSETFGLVGESGCGKSTVARSIMRLYKPTDGQIIFQGDSIESLREKDMRPFRKDIQMIFQDPYASLNPRMTIRQIIEEPMNVHKMSKGSEREDRIAEVLKSVGLTTGHLNRYPHEFSGGQRQRIGIARALVVEPKFIICDEPISALDVSIQAQVVNMLQDLQEEKNIAYLFIAHDLAMVKHISHRMGVMYLGVIVEISSSENIYTTPLHPYTQGLLESIPICDPIEAQKREEISIHGEIPSPLNPPSGCRFRTRCKKASEICRVEKPILKEVNKEHFVACHLF